MLRSIDYDYMYRDEEPADFIRRASRAKSLSREEELSLIRAWRCHRDESAYNTLSARFQKMLAAESRRFIARYNMPQTSFGDALQEANIAFRRAIDQFDEARQMRLQTYLRPKVIAQLRIQMIKEQQAVNPPLSRKYLKVHSNLGRILKKLLPDGRPPSSKDLDQVAEILEVKPYHVMAVYRGQAGYVELNRPSVTKDEEDYKEIGDFFESDEQSPEDVVVQYDVVQRGQVFLRAALDTLNERERKIFIERNLTDPQPSYRDMAPDYGVSWQRIEQIDKKALEKVSGYVREAMKGACVGKPCLEDLRRPSGLKAELVPEIT